MCFSKLKEFLQNLKLLLKKFELFKIKKKKHLKKFGTIDENKKTLCKNGKF